MPRFGGIATMMRLPHVENPAGLDVGFVGVPLDIGTSNAPHAFRSAPDPHRIGAAAPYNMATRAAPFDSLKVADLGDVALNPYSLLDSVRMIEEAYDAIYATGCKTISLGGDHTLTLPILRAMARHRGRSG
jgi:guanidinobutyrase